MIFFFTGTDRKKAYAAMNAAVKKLSKKESRIVRISDANQPEDLRAALGGKGMFDESRIVVFNGVLTNEEMRTELLDSLAHMRDSEEIFFVLEEKPDAATRKQIEKYAEKSERYDSPSGKKEAIHGILFWAAKDMLLKSRTDAEKARAKRFIAELAELPHESRRRGIELEYALELFVLR